MIFSGHLLPPVKKKKKKAGVQRIPFIIFKSNLQNQIKKDILILFT